MRYNYIKCIQYFWVKVLQTYKKLIWMFLISFKIAKLRYNLPEYSVIKCKIKNFLLIILESNWIILVLSQVYEVATA